jgi:general secretion pathway protein M
MSPGNWIDSHVARFPSIATAAYVAFIVGFGWTIFSSIADVIDRRSEVAAAKDILEQLQSRKRIAPDAGGNASMRAGSPFLEGPTVTVAGASLLQRLTSAVISAGGNVLTTQVDLQGEKSKTGLIGVTANCEVDQPSLQQLLYDLEAGMPFLFVDQLLVQMSAFSGARDSRMRVTLAVYGQWQGEK